MSLYEDWIAAKEAESVAMAVRRAIEDELVQELSIDMTDEGTQSRDLDGYKIKAVVRMNRKIDGDLLQEIAAENGLSHHLGTLFRWKPEMSVKAWKATNENITRPLLAAITTTPGRPSFTITKES
jgi:hypothetical protein